MSGIHVHVEQNVSIGGVVVAPPWGPFFGGPGSNAGGGEPPRQMMNRRAGRGARGGDPRFPLGQVFPLAPELLACFCL